MHVRSLSFFAYLCLFLSRKKQKWRGLFLSTPGKYRWDWLFTQITFMAKPYVGACSWPCIKKPFAIAFQVAVIRLSILFVFFVCVCSAPSSLDWHLRDMVSPSWTGSIWRTWQSQLPRTWISSCSILSCYTVMPDVRNIHSCLVLPFLAGSYCAFIVCLHFVFTSCQKAFLSIPLKSLATANKATARWITVFLLQHSVYLGFAEAMRIN